MAGEDRRHSYEFVPGTHDILGAPRLTKPSVSPGANDAGNILPMPQRLISLIAFSLFIQQPNSFLQIEGRQERKEELRELH